MNANNSVIIHAFTCSVVGPTYVCKSDTHGPVWTQDRTKAKVFKDKKAAWKFIGDHINNFRDPKVIPA